VNLLIIYMKLNMHHHFCDYQIVLVSPPESEMPVH